MSFETRLTDLGITLPPAPAPVASYVPAVRSGNLLFVSGQISDAKGYVGDDVALDGGTAAARDCALKVLAQARAALGSLDHVLRVVRLGGFVASGAGFDRQPEVVNGASDLMIEVFGEAGRHARAAVSVPALPRGAAVEVDAIFEVTP